MKTTTRFKKLLCTMAFMLILSLSSICVRAALPVIPADVTTASSGCTILGIEGTYVLDIQTVVNRINEIREEAYKLGYVDRYVPVAWSGDLEYIARLRAAESSLTEAHKRLNNKGSHSIKSPGGVYAVTEVLAWSGNSTMKRAVEQWYSEKKKFDPNNKTAMATGHYWAMINPDNTYVGMATFLSNVGAYYNTTAGEFASEKGTTKEGTVSGKCIQLVEVANTALTGKFNISGTTNLAPGKSSVITITAGTVYSGKGLYIPSAAWKSSKTGVAKVSSTGVVTAGSKTGTAKITVTLAGGRKTTFNVKVAKIKTKSVKFTASKTKLAVGETFELKTKVTPANTTDTLKFKSSNKKVVSVSSTGVMTAKKKGKAKITVTSGSKKKTITVTVK